MFLMAGSLTKGLLMHSTTARCIVCRAFSSLEALNLLPTAQVRQQLQEWLAAAAAEDATETQSHAWLLDRLQHRQRWREQWETPVCQFLEA